MRFNESVDWSGTSELSRSGPAGVLPVLVIHIRSVPTSLHRIKTLNAL